MQGMLSFLLFAGALHVDLNQLRRVAWQVGSLALIGTVLSTLIIGFGSSYLLSLLGIAIPLSYCLLFGALISPTDPIAVLSVLKSANVPPNVEATIAGESLFNDGVGVVLFALLLDMLHRRRALSAPARPIRPRGVRRRGVRRRRRVLVCRVLRTIDDSQVEMLITLATVVGGYARLASRVEAAGDGRDRTLDGNEGRAAMSARTRHASTCSGI
jgi:CPA1 family monovalent cation:H+ antiporter